MTVVQKDAKSAPQKVIVISRDERKQIEDRIHSMMKAASVDLLVAAAPGNFAYVSGFSLPYAEQYGTPKTAAVLGDKLTAVLPPEWAQFPEDMDRECEVSVYTSSEGLFTDAVIAHIAALAKGAKQVGVDRGDLPVDFAEKLEKVLGVKCIDISKDLKKLRMVKTPAEIRMLETAVRFVDRASIAALNHSEGTTCDPLSYYTWEFAERVRVHIGEFGGSGSGNITALQGSDMRFLSKNPTGLLKEGEPLRYEATGNHLGYWASGARTFFVGTPKPEFEAEYDNNIALKNKAAALLKPGVKACEVYEQILSYAKEMGVSVFSEAGFGYGVGTTEREAPYLSPSDDTKLEEGMVIVLAVYTYGPDKELICSKDTYEITAGGSRLMSWYKSFDQLYAITGTHSRHG